MRVITLILCCVLCCVLCGCSNQKDGQKSPSKNSVTITISLPDDLSLDPYQPVDTWTSSYAIANVERDREASRQAEKELSAEMAEKLVAQRLVQERQVDPYFPLTKKNRELIHKYWEKITEGMSNREIVGLMKLLDLKYDDKGNIVDISGAAEAKEKQNKEVDKWRKVYHCTQTDAKEVMEDTAQTQTSSGGTATVAVPEGVFPSEETSKEVPEN